ncbi:Uncharacterised protein [Legionella busanensis]|uniref:Uncharacterized protein n=1 Tax=Legionella busanensis TaxID=190655 RepID=A0A378JSZ4_9GAMM|nr:Uncharacterised protein [Legionella busanensis]
MEKPIFCSIFRLKKIIVLYKDILTLSLIQPVLTEADSLTLEIMNE